MDALATDITLAELLEPILALEGTAPRFAKLLLYAWQAGAEVFATDLAFGGADPDQLDTMADRWRDFDYDPPEYAAALEFVARELRKARAAEGWD